jgi:hypothetical protein
MNAHAEFGRSARHVPLSCWQLRDPTAPVRSRTGARPSCGAPAPGAAAGPPAAAHRPLRAPASRTRSPLALALLLRKTAALPGSRLLASGLPEVDLSALLIRHTCGPFRSAGRSRRVSPRRARRAVPPARPEPDGPDSGVRPSARGRLPAPRSGRAAGDTGALRQTLPLRCRPGHGPRKSRVPGPVRPRQSARGGEFRGGRMTRSTRGSVTKANGTPGPVLREPAPPTPGPGPGPPGPEPGPAPGPAPAPGPDPVPPPAPGPGGPDPVPPNPQPPTPGPEPGPAPDPAPGGEAGAKPAG